MMIQVLLICRGHCSQTPILYWIASCTALKVNGCFNRWQPMSLQRPTFTYKVIIIATIFISEGVNRISWLAASYMQGMHTQDPCWYSFTSTICNVGSWDHTSVSTCSVAHTTHVRFSSYNSHPFEIGVSDKALHCPSLAKDQSQRWHAWQRLP